MAQQNQNIDLVNQAKNAVVQLGNIFTALSKAFPQNTGTATSATGGTATALPAQPVGYLLVTLQDGTQAKIPYYS